MHVYAVIVLCVAVCGSLPRPLDSEREQVMAFYLNVVHLQMM